MKVQPPRHGDSPEPSGASQQYWPQPPHGGRTAGPPPRRSRRTAFLLVAALVLVAGVGGAWWVGREVQRFFGGCTATQQLSQQLVDQLRPVGFEFASASYVCSSTFTSHDDNAELWLTSQRGFADRKVLVRTASDVLTAAGWTARPNKAHDDTGSEEAFAGERAPDQTIGRNSFQLQLRGRSANPPVLVIRVLNQGPQAATSDGRRLPERPLGAADRRRFSLAPTLYPPLVPDGYKAWREVDAYDIDRSRYELTPGAYLEAGAAPAGLDPADTCGDGIWGRFTHTPGGRNVHCLRIGTAKGDVPVYVPVSTEDAVVETTSRAVTRGDSSTPAETAPAGPVKQVIRYGPPMALVGSTSVMLIGVNLPSGDVIVNGRPAADGDDAVTLTRQQVLAIFGSLRVRPATRF